MAARIWIVLQLREGHVTRHSWEAIGAGQQLAEAVGGASVEAVVLGQGIEAAAKDAARAALAGVHVVEAPELADYTPGVLIGALAPAIERERPAFVLFPHTYQTVDYVPRLAQTVGAALIPEATGMTQKDGQLLWRRPVLGGKLHAGVRVKGEGTVLVSLQSGAFSADLVKYREGTPVDAWTVPAGSLVPDREILGREQAGAQEIDLTKADVIVAVGRGIGGAEYLGPIEELAKALGAELGASRPVIDSGWLPRERQIGSSGQTVAPKLYVALGISGAIQHLVGMKGSSVVVAINKDPSAPIFAIARYGIVGDLHEIVPALTAALKASR